MKRGASVYIVTGAAGFIGSAICRRLLDAEGAGTVIGIDNFSPYYSPRIKHYRIRSLRQYAPFVFIHAPVGRVAALRNIVATYRPTVLVHTAAAVGVRHGEDDPSGYFETNILGTNTLLQELRHTVKHAVLFSSSSVYGNCPILPFPETYDVTVQTPISTYGVSKACMEALAFNFFRQTAIPLTVVRPFSVYGPDGRPDMLPMRLIDAAVTGKTLELYGLSHVRRDWTYIDDVVECIVRILRKPAGYQVCNIGSGAPVSLREVVRVAQRAFKARQLKLSYVRKPLRSIEMPVTYADTSTVRRLFAWEPTIQFEQGFARTLDYYLHHQTLYRGS